MFRKYKDKVNAESKSKGTEKAPQPTNDQPKVEQKRPPMSQRSKSTLDKDVMISYSHQNRPFMRKLKEALTERGISVWVDETGLKAGVDFLSKIGQAIIDAKCFISLLSFDSIKSKYCEDELALAYVSQKPIFPCGLVPAEELFPKMGTGMKLQVARFEWAIFSEDDPDFDPKMDKLVTRIKAACAGSSEAVTAKPNQRNKHEKQHNRKSMNRTNTRKSVFLEQLSTTEFSMAEAAFGSFWEQHFSNKKQVSWQEFIEVFNRVYKSTLSMLYTSSDQEWLIGIIQRELEVGPSNNVTKSAFDDFCTVDDEMRPFFIRVQDQAVESYTMREVFSMDSSVRLDAIENLGKFHSAAVVGALVDLLTDPDNNVRAVAAISLARTGEDSDEVVDALLPCLKDKDRLVRESGCLALGHLKVTKAVPAILHLWRNDFISHVREAAQVALEQIGGEEAEDAIHMTQVLSDEIRFLVQE